MTDCPRADIRDLLPDWVHGTLDAAAAATVSSHVAACAECAAEAELLSNARAALARSPRVDTGRIAAAVIASRVRAQGRPRWAAMAGILAVAAGIAVVMLGGPSERETGSTAAVIDTADTTPTAAVDTGIPRQLAVVDTAESASTSPIPSLAPGGARPQLVMGGGITDFADQELEALLGALDGVDGLPSVSPEPIVTSPVVVSSTQSSYDE